jgi:hypothetical protein
LRNTNTERQDANVLVFYFGRIIYMPAYSHLPLLATGQRRTSGALISGWQRRDKFVIDS